ncbi:MAG: MarR family transcriptional regulator [Burkholderiales bacterium]|nr:MarR family transcriptional regulator [Burkholderiales bacterium]
MSVAAVRPTPAPGARPPRPAAAKRQPGRLDDSGLAHLVGYAASRAALELRKVFTVHMDPHGLTTPQFSILMLVADNGDVNQKQLGQALDISPPNMAVTLDRMAERGWIERVRSTRDRRAQQIHLTAAGRALAERTRRIAATMEEPALAALSRAERALLIELLRKIVPESAAA